MAFFNRPPTTFVNGKALVRMWRRKTKVEGERQPLELLTESDNSATAGFRTVPPINPSTTGRSACACTRTHRDVTARCSQGSDYFHQVPSTFSVPGMTVWLPVSGELGGHRRGVFDC